MVDSIGNTPADTNNDGTTPSVSPDTLPQKTSPTAGIGDIKVEAAVEVERLKNEILREQARAKTAQAELAQAKSAARAEKTARIKAERDLRSVASGVVQPLDNSNSSATEREIQLQAQIMIKDILIENPQYRELVDNDPTLKEVIKNNPFVLINDYFDASDAVEQFKEKLDTILRSKTQPKKEVSETREPPVIETKVVQPSSGTVPAADRKSQATGDSIADSIASKVRFV